MRKIEEYNVRIISISSASIDLTVLRSKDDRAIFEYEEVEEMDVSSHVINDEWRIKINRVKGRSIFSLLFDVPFWKTIRGFLHIPDRVEELMLKTASGDVEMKGLSLKRVELSSVSGDLRVENSNLHELHMRSTSGNVKTRNTRIENMSLASVSGDLQLDYLPRNFGYLRISTVSGDARIYVEGNEEIMVKKRSKFSDVSSNIPMRMVEHVPRGPEMRRYIEFSAVSGDLLLELRHGEEGGRHAGTEEYKILELLKQGKISRDFAIELLMNLGYSEEEANKFLSENER